MEVGKKQLSTSEKWVFALLRLFYFDDHVGLKDLGRGLDNARACSGIQFVWIAGLKASFCLHKDLVPGTDERLDRPRRCSNAILALFNFFWYTNCNLLFFGHLPLSLNTG